MSVQVSDTDMRKAHELTLEVVDKHDQVLTLDPTD